MVEPRADPRLRVLLAVTALVTAARMIWASAVELAPDEAYYWLWSRHPALGYRDHPPLVAWIESLVPTSLGSVSEVWVRLPALVSGLLLAPALYALVRAAGVGRQVALPAVLAAALCPIASAGAVILTPDCALSVLWVVALAAALAFARGGARPLFVLSCTAGALCVLAKLTGILILPVLAACLASRSGPRRRLVGTVAAGVVPLAAAAAILVAGEAGQAMGPATFQLRRLGDASLHPLGPLAFVGSQVALLGILPAAGVVELARRASGPDGAARRVLQWAFWPAMALLVPLSVVIHVEANWAAVALPAVAAGWALLLERMGSRRPLAGRMMAWTGALVCALLSLLLHLHTAAILAPSLVGAGAAARLHGHRALVRVLRSSAPAMLETSDYRLYAPVAYYGRDDPRIRLVAPERAARCNRPDWVFKVTDARLKLVREVTVCRSDGPGGVIRYAGR